MNSPRRQTPPRLACWKITQRRGELRGCAWRCLSDRQALKRACISLGPGVFRGETIDEGVVSERRMLAIKRQAEKVADGVVLCAVDLGPLTGRVLSHAAGFARALHARLRIIHVAESGATHEAPVAVRRAYTRVVGDAIGDDPEIAVRTGPVALRILQETMDRRTRLLVMGTRALGPLARLVLGSTSEAVLRAAKVPVLLVPPGDQDIVSLVGRGASLMIGKDRPPEGG